MRDLHSNITLVPSIDPIVGNNDTEGTGVGVDLADVSAAEMVFHFGISADTLSGSVSVLPVLQESDTLGSGYSTVAAADMIGSLSIIDDPAKDPAVQAVGYTGNKRFIRAFVDFTGTHTNGIPIAAVAVLHRRRHIGATV